jgi:hypothetical protein
MFLLCVSRILIAKSIGNFGENKQTADFEANKAQVFFV